MKHTRYVTLLLFLFTPWLCFSQETSLLNFDSEDFLTQIATIEPLFELNSESECVSYKTFSNIFTKLTKLYETTKNQHLAAPSARSTERLEELFGILSATQVRIAKIYTFKDPNNPNNLQLMAQQAQLSQMTQEAADALNSALAPMRRKQYIFIAKAILATGLLIVGSYVGYKIYKYLFGTSEEEQIMIDDLHSQAENISKELEGMKEAVSEIKEENDGISQGIDRGLEITRRIKTKIEQDKSTLEFLIRQNILTKQQRHEIMELQRLVGTLRTEMKELDDELERQREDHIARDTDMMRIEREQKRILKREKANLRKRGRKKLRGLSECSESMCFIMDEFVNKMHRHRRTKRPGIQ